MTDAFLPRTAATLDSSPAIPHLIQNVCRPAGSMLLFGRTGIGKTRFLWQLACGWAHGLETFTLQPARPLRITIVEADMYRSDFESMIKEYRSYGIIPNENLQWFARDDDSLYNVAGAFGQTLKQHNIAFDTDLTIYDAVPDVTLGDPNDMQVAYQTLRAIAAASNSRAYLGVLVQRKGSTQRDPNEEEENIDNMLGSQSWGRQASTVWQMTKVPSLVWVKHRLCAQPPPIIFQKSKQGIFSLRSEASRGIIYREALKGYSSIRELADRVMQAPEYANLPGTQYKDRMLRDVIQSLISRKVISGPANQPDNL